MWVQVVLLGRWYGKTSLSGKTGGQSTSFVALNFIYLLLGRYETEKGLARLACHAELYLLPFNLQSLFDAMRSGTWNAHILMSLMSGGLEIPRLG